MYAHRFAFKRRFGHLPPVLDHLCRQPACCNPDHLEAVSQAENCRRGKSTKLTRAQVEEMRILYRRGMKQTEIAKLFGVSPSHVSRSVRGKAWR